MPQEDLPLALRGTRVGRCVRFAQLEVSFNVYPSTLAERAQILDRVVVETEDMMPCCRRIWTGCGLKSDEVGHIS
jgi:hypothetical protein